MDRQEKTDAGKGQRRQRNVDRFDSEEAARKVFYGEYFGPTEQEYVDSAFISWLFAPAPTCSSGRQVNGSNMYETLKYADTVLAYVLGWKEFDIEKLEGLYRKVHAAVSAPPRNCDRFERETDAQTAFLNEVWLVDVDKSTASECDRFENWTDEMKNRYAAWLFAPGESGAAK